jgi:hypothetical protein
MIFYGLLLCSIDFDYCLVKVLEPVQYFSIMLGNLFEFWQHSHQVEFIAKTSELQDSQIVGNFFEFLTPLHKTEFIAKGSWSGCTYAIDFFFRIFEGLLIYQMVQAFRKYSRKL